MKRGEGACLVCGKPVVYYEKAKMMECMMCHRQFESRAGCEDGHYVCDECHASKGIEIIMEECKSSSLKNPVELMQKLMEEPYIYMHGPEHHVMVGAALLTAYYNCKGFDGGTARADFEAALEEMNAWGAGYPGGSGGLWGCGGGGVCGGLFLCFVPKATPLTGKSWRLSNQMTAEALGAIAKLGGPRCCKRNSFTAAAEAARFAKEHLEVEMELPKEICCGFSEENRECLRKKCPYHV